MSDAIAKGDVQAINYFVAQKYMDALGKLATSPNQKVLMMPLEASSVIGALSGIAELAKDAMEKQMRAEREKRAMIAESERDKQAKRTFRQKPKRAENKQQMPGDRTRFFIFPTPAERAKR